MDEFPDLRCYCHNFSVPLPYCLLQMSVVVDNFSQILCQVFIQSMMVDYSRLFYILHYPTQRLNPGDQLNQNSVKTTLLSIKPCIRRNNNNSLFIRFKIKNPDCRLHFISREGESNLEWESNVTIKMFIALLHPSVRAFSRVWRHSNISLFLP